MSENPFRQDRQELRELLLSYNKLKKGNSYAFIDEEGFERIIDYFLEKDQFVEALEAADIAIDQFSYSASLLILKADCLLSMRRYESSLSILEKAVLFDSRNASLYIIKTAALLALDRQEEAAETLEFVIDLFEGEEKIELLFELADVYDDYENFDKVFDCLKIILDFQPENEEALYKICFWTDHTGRNEDSINIHQKIIEKNPYSELAWFNLGAAYQGIRLYEKAIDAYQYAVAINEKFDYAYRNIADAFIRLKKYKEAIESLERVISLSMPEVVIFEAIGHCYDKINKFSQARQYYKKACHLNPEDSQMIYKVACTYMSEGLWQNAVKTLQHALKFHVLQPEYNLAIGRCFLQMGNYDDAITHLGNVVRVRPKNLKGWTELLNCLYQGGLYEEGFEYAAHAFELTESKPIFVYYKVAFLFAMGKSKQALEYLEYALIANAKLVKHLVEINPSILQSQQVVDLIARFKKSPKYKK